MDIGQLLFWASPPKEEYYVVKQKKGHDYLTAKDVICTHIANGIYRMFGVKTPDLYIGTYQDQLSLISKVLPNYKDLYEWLEAEDPVNEINQHSDISDCIDTYKNLERNLNIQNKEALLAAAIILEDSDVIGAGLRNIGLIKSNGKHCIVKIDPDEGIFHPLHVENSLNEFKKHFSLEHPYFYDIFSIESVFNNPNSILGNLHFSEFFHDIDPEKLKSALTMFASLDDDNIKNLINRDEYLSLLGAEEGDEFLQQLYSLILGKKEIIKQYMTDLTKTTTAVLNPVFNNDLNLSEPLETITYGASKPLKVKRILPEDTEETIQFIGKSQILS